MTCMCCDDPACGGCGCTNVGLVYVNNAHPHGPVAWAVQETWDRFFLGEKALCARAFFVCLLICLLACLLICLLAWRSVRV